jgi:hypothetical protein
VRRWKELVKDKKNGEVLFDRPKPTASCSANGRRRICSSYRDDVVVGLARSYEPESYADGSLAAGRSPMPDRSKMMDQTKRDTLILQVGGR